MKHLAAKLIVANYFIKINLVKTCSRRKHKHERRYDGCTSLREFRYDGCHSADVAIFDFSGTLRAIVEVKYSHATTGEALDSRISRVGAENVWEVEATRVINLMSALYRGETINLVATNTAKCAPCGMASKLRMDVHRPRQNADDGTTAKKRNVTVEKISNTLVRRDGVLLKKCLPISDTNPKINPNSHTWIAVEKGKEEALLADHKHA